MTTTMEEANAMLRQAVGQRLEAVAAGRSAEQWYDPQDDVPVYRGDSILAEDVYPASLPRGSSEWRSLHDELLALHAEKTGQYGHEDSAFANVEASALCGVEPWRRCLCDLSDCVVRMQRFANGQPVDYENALKDAAMWAMICLVMLRRGRDAS